jgi:trimeric autotransporter adhesin
MSTKTTFKRVALVAVAALGLGLLSVAPSNASVAADSLTVTNGTAVVGDSVTATSASATISFLPSAFATDSMSVTASLVSGPAANTLFPVLTLGETTSAKVAPLAGGGESVTGSKFPAYAPIYIVGKAAAVTTAKFNVYIGDVAANTGVVTAGTYVVRITPAAAPTAGTATFKDITIVVTAANTAAVSAYANLAVGANTPNPTLGAIDSVVAGSKVPAATPTRIGSIGVTLLNSAGTTVAESYTATITGAGTLGNSGAGTTVVGRSITMKSSDNVHIFADGSGGVGTITISSAAGVLLATKTVSFYGDPAVVTLSSNSNAVVGTLAAPVKATVYDAAGYVVAGAQLYTTSADTTIISNSYTKIATTTAADGTVSIPLTGVKLGSAKITVGLASSATDVTTTGYAVKSDALTVTVGGSTSEQAGVVVTTDKQVYTPGSYAYVTVKAVDKDGKTLSPRPTTTDVYTVFATGGISASLPIETVTGIISSTGFVPAAKAGTATAADPIVAQAGEFVYKIKLPTYSGDLTLSWTTAAASNFPGNIAAGGVAGSVTVSLSDPGSQAAVDAATEATDAANAATDAALAAADAADAATAAAEDAAAAVATLAKSVDTALGNLKKQITALTKLVNKLLKK